jgi:SAM-dependent methyltransferase
MHHQHSTTSRDHSFDPAEILTQEFWEARYRSSDQVWSGNPNPRLVEHVSVLTPGTALDAGCGEGADAIWLAARGWRVTAIDVSTVALERGATEAAATGADIAGRITWQQADILSWEPIPEQFDLVSAQFIHLPTREREVFHGKLASAVRPGGTLLIVAHHPSDLDTSMQRPNMPDFFFTADQIAARLDPADWQIDVAGAPEREATDPDGHPIAIRDTVLMARRRV